MLSLSSLHRSGSSKFARLKNDDIDEAEDLHTFDSDDEDIGVFIADEQQAGGVKVSVEEEEEEEEDNRLDEEVEEKKSLNSNNIGKKKTKRRKKVTEMLTHPFQNTAFATANINNDNNSSSDFDKIKNNTFENKKELFDSDDKLERSANNNNSDYKLGKNIAEEEEEETADDIVFLLENSEKETSRKNQFFWFVWNTFWLSFSYMLGMAVHMMKIATGNLSASTLHSANFASVPLAMLFLGSAVFPVPIALAVKRYGRRATSIFGGFCGALGSLLVCLSLNLGGDYFWLYTLGTFLLGALNTSTYFFRFAVLEIIPHKKYKVRAISAVIFGGILAGVAGPQIARGVFDLLSVPFAGVYLVMVCLSVLLMLIQFFIRYPKKGEDNAIKMKKRNNAAKREMHPMTNITIPTNEEEREEEDEDEDPSVGQDLDVERPVGAIVRQPDFLMAVIVQALSYTTMLVVMSMTPIHMRSHLYDFNASSNVVTAHVVSMFFPSLFSPLIIEYLGIPWAMIVGLAIMLGGSIVLMVDSIAAAPMAIYYVGLCSVGLGWNFSFIAATTLVSKQYRPSETFKMQGINDFVVFGVVAVGCIGSAFLYTNIGWVRYLILFGALQLFVLVLSIGYLIHIKWFRTRRSTSSSSLLMMNKK